jgi:hypothetical protein
LGIPNRFNLKSPGAGDASSENPVDAATVEVDNLKPPTEGVTEFPDFGQLPKLIKHKARSGVIGTLFRY